MKNAIIALDYTGMDECLISNSKSFLDSCNISDLTFIHVVPNYLNLENLYIEDCNPCEQDVKTLVSNLIMNKVKKVYGEGKKYNIDCKILEGSPYRQLISYIKSNNTNLLVIGKKHKSRGSGITSRRVAHHVGCNVLFVSEEINHDIIRIGVPIDFSANSARALKTAIDTLPKTCMIKPVHVISHTPTDHYLGLNYNSTYRQMYLEEAKKAYKDLLYEYRIDTSRVEEISFLEDSYGNIARHIKEFFSLQDIDLIVMGARGHNALDSILYGSVAEKFVDYNDSIPTLVIR